MRTKILSYDGKTAYDYRPNSTGDMYFVPKGHCGTPQVWVIDIYYPEEIGTVVAGAINDPENPFDPDKIEYFPGRPPMFDQKMKQTAVWLPKNQIEWLKNQPGTMSEAIRELIVKAMSAE